MSHKAALLFLHGVGSGDQNDNWKAALDRALTDVGYPQLDEAEVAAPKYAFALRGSDDNDPLPGVTIKAPSGEARKRNRRDFDRRMVAVEMRLGRHDRGVGWFGGDQVIDNALGLRSFEQAKNYLTNRQIRAQVLNRVLRGLPKSDSLVIVGHSLGSVIAADLLRRLPVGLEVAGLITIGSPLAHPSFDPGDLRAELTEPPQNLAWWVNFWNPADPVTAHRGVSSVFPWMMDSRIQPKVNLQAHDAETYLADEAVATTVGYALFGSLSRTLVVAERGIDTPLDYPETLALMALRYAYLTMTKLEGDRRERYSNALRLVQANTFDRVKERNDRVERPIPNAIAGLMVDLSDPASVAHEPSRINHLSKEEAIVPLTVLATENVIQPFEIDVPEKVRIEAIEDLTKEMGLGRQMGRDVHEAAEEARRVLTGSGTAWFKWASIGVGALALTVATGGLALAAAPGLAGAAAITSALAAFGPGGMIGGLLTAGSLATVGGGGLMAGLANPTTTAETVEAVVSTQLAAAILRKRQGLEEAATTWNNLVETENELRREIARLGPLSDESAPALKRLKRKLDTINRALNYLSDKGLGPIDSDDTGSAKGFGPEWFGRAADAFRPVDLDGDGVPDKPRAQAAMDDAAAVVKDAAAGAAGAFNALFHRKPAEEVPADDDDSEPAD